MRTRTITHVLSIASAAAVALGMSVARDIDAQTQHDVLGAWVVTRDIDIKSSEGKQPG